MKISVCVCTYRRPQGLARLLASLRTIHIPPAMALELVVVDNDAAGSAQPGFAAATAGWPWPARYVVEPRSGVGYARERCVLEAGGDWIAFIDDDEWAEPQWLAELCQARTSLEADGIFGPVVSVFEEAAPAWLVASRLFDRARRASGSRMHWSQCASGNVLFRKSLFAQVGGFDPVFAKSGSEDSDFFWRCLEAGAQFYWCDEAVAYEGVPAARMTESFVRRRAFRAGQNFTRLNVRRQGAGSYLVFALRGVASASCFGLAALLTRPFSKGLGIRMQCKCLGGLGKVLAALSLVKADYGTAQVPAKSQS